MVHIPFPETGSTIGNETEFWLVSTRREEWREAAWRREYEEEATTTTTITTTITTTTTTTWREEQEQEHARSHTKHTQLRRQGRGRRRALLFKLRYCLGAREDVWLLMPHSRGSQWSRKVGTGILGALVTPITMGLHGLGKRATVSFVHWASSSSHCREVLLFLSLHAIYPINLNFIWWNLK